MRPATAPALLAIVARWPGLLTAGARWGGKLRCAADPATIVALAHGRAPVASQATDAALASRLP
jgi:hypothetical protein